MQALADKVLGRLHFTLEQVQDLTPTPMTLSSVMFYTGVNPYTGEEVYVARSQEDKRRQKAYFFGGKLPTEQNMQRRSASSRPAAKPYAAPSKGKKSAVQGVERSASPKRRFAKKR